MKVLAQLATIVVLAAAAGSMAVIGWKRWRRTGWLATAAHRRRWRFLPEETSGIWRRCGRFLIFQIGHDLRVENVADGHESAWRLRTFDLRFERGRAGPAGGQTIAAASAEGPTQMPNMVVVRGDKLPVLTGLTMAPLQGAWRFWGDRNLAQAIATSLDQCPLGDLAAEALDGVVLVYGPASLSDKEPPDLACWALDAARAVPEPEGVS